MAVEGIRLYLQPVQDLTIEDRVSRTQYQYALEAADAKVLDQWVPRMVELMQLFRDPRVLPPQGIARTLKGCQQLVSTGTEP